MTRVKWVMVRGGSTLDEDWVVDLSGKPPTDLLGTGRTRGGVARTPQDNQGDSMISVQPEAVMSRREEMWPWQRRRE